MVTALDIIAASLADMGDLDPVTLPEDGMMRPVHGFDDICAVPCPQCGAEAGSPCLRVRWFHVRRKTAALRASGWTSKDEARWQRERSERFEAERLAQMEEWHRNHPDGSYEAQPGKWCRTLSADAPPSWLCMAYIRRQWFVLHIWQNRPGGLHRWRIGDPTGQVDWAKGWTIRLDAAKRRARIAAKRWAGIDYGPEHVD